MLDRYEYQMSISIVMNSVEPPQKSTQRPPPPQGRPRERLLKKMGHRLSQTKQKRNRKKNRKYNNLSEIMDENSLETLCYLTPGDQHPLQSEKEDFEETKTGCSFTGGLQNEFGDFVNVCKEKSWKNIDPEDSFKNVKSAVELDNTSKNCFPKEDDGLFLTLSSMPNESSFICPTGTQNFSWITRDDCSGMEVEKHMGDRYNLALDAQDLFAETPCSVMQKTEVVDQRLPSEPVLCHQHRSRTSQKVLREEQGVQTTRNNYWAFFTTNLSDEELQLGSERQSYFGSWPEGPHKFVCEQRPKKDRSCKLACPDSKEQLIKLISTSEGTSVPGNSPEILIEEKLLIENEDLSLTTETIDPFREPETNNFVSCLHQLDESTESNKRRQKRIFNLAPNFSLLGQSHISAKDREEHFLLSENHGLNIILGEGKHRISEITNTPEKKQKIMTFDHHPLYFYLDIINDSFLMKGEQFYSLYLSLNRLGHAVYFYKNPVPSLVLHYISSFWMVSCTSKKTFLTFKSQTIIGNRLNDIEFISSENLSSQPDTLCCLKATSDTQFLNERTGEKMKSCEESKPLQYLPTEDHQDLRSIDFNPLWLPLSQGFAFQLVKLFGAPGVPMETLLPDDYMIPLDWKTLKMIYLQWKMSVEKRQKNKKNTLK
ncbi:NEDD4-binding protein 2-like 2 isoform X3 [Castor canadensis]